MTEVRAAVEVDAPPDRVWAVVADPRNLPRWDRRIAAVVGVPETGLAVGSTYTTELRFMGLRSTVRADVEDVRPPEMARIRLSGILDAVVTTRLTPLDDGRRTRLEQEVKYRFRGGPLGRMTAEALRLTGGAGHTLRRGIQAQKRQVEEGWPGPLP